MGRGVRARGRAGRSGSDGTQTSFFYGKRALTAAKHRYRKAGRYTVTLTLVDNRGNLQSTTQGVTISPRRS